MVTVKSETSELIRGAMLLPPFLRTELLHMPEELAGQVEEIRLRAGRPPSLVLGDRELDFVPSHKVTPAELQLVLEIATRASAHTYADSIRAGFVTAEGGCRLGLCGTAVTEDFRISGIRRLSSVCIRIPHEKKGCADTIFDKLTRGGFASTLILSPPGGGKTTLLRELIRRLSDGGMQTALVDERSEVAGTFEGQPSFDLGARTDVLTGAPKCEGIFLLLRSMSPRLLAFDEITAPTDIEAAEAATNCGVRLLATAHGESLADLKRRPLYCRLLERGIFKRGIIIENEGGKRHYRVEEIS